MRIFVALYSLAGAALIVYGLWQWWEPAAWIVGGAYVVFDAWRMSRLTMRQKDAEPSS